MRLRQPSHLNKLSALLSLDDSKLASLNDVERDHQFDKGDWLVLPSGSIRLAKLLPQIDSTDLRRTPPLHALPPVETNGVVKLGDTLRKIALRYGLTLQELLRQNPGIETARLVVGAPIRVVQSSPAKPRMLLALKPTTSGGLSWPELPDFGADGPNLDSDRSADGWIWPTRGMFSSGFGWRWGRMHKG
ncbi:MAG: LysM peptidoglycan-binding domain-containing protein, partial [Prochlorococcaceae cyanobacterium]